MLQSTVLSSSLSLFLSLSILYTEINFFVGLIQFLGGEPTDPQVHPPMNKTVRCRRKREKAIPKGREITQFISNQNIITSTKISCTKNYWATLKLLKKETGSLRTENPVIKLNLRKPKVLVNNTREVSLPLINGHKYNF